MAKAFIRSIGQSHVGISNAGTWKTVPAQSFRQNRLYPASLIPFWTNLPKVRSHQGWRRVFIGAKTWRTCVWPQASGIKYFTHPHWHHFPPLPRLHDTLINCSITVSFCLLAFPRFSACMTAMADEEITEFRLLYEGSDPIVDIVAVENINEEYRRCWTYQGEREPILWLEHKDFLPKKFPNSRIFSFGYQFNEDSGSQALGENLLQRLVDDRAKSKVRKSTIPFNTRITEFARQTDRFFGLA